MSDQADGLRQLVQARTASGSGGTAVADPPAAARVTGTPPTRTRSLVLTSGKGGVGTSNLALNLAVALGELGERVVLVDADLGLANIDLLCGLAPASDLGDVLVGDQPLAEAIVQGPAGIRIVPGAHGMRPWSRSWVMRPLAWSWSWRSSRPRPTSCWWTPARGWGQAS